MKVIPVYGRWHMTDKPATRGEIFVVDDDPAVRETLSIVLSAGGYQVVCFADGAALLAVARTRTPSCILLDVHIPGNFGSDGIRTGLWSPVLTRFLDAYRLSTPGSGPKVCFARKRYRTKAGIACAPYRAVTCATSPRITLARACSETCCRAEVK
jgi:hypothetical protein